MERRVGDRSGLNHELEFKVRLRFTSTQKGNSIGLGGTSRHLPDEVGVEEWFRKSGGVICVDIEAVAAVIDFEQDHR